MDRFDRIYELYRILARRRTPIALQDLQARMECSEPTVKRTIRALREQLNAPIEYDRDGGGYVLRADRGDEPRWELPGVWFNARELHALLVIEELLENIGEGLLGPELAPLRSRVEKLLSGQHGGLAALRGRLRILTMGHREIAPGIFGTVASALAERRRISVIYHGRARDRETRRELSPQRLAHYRDNWYLDAWCHTRKGLRVFSLDRIVQARPLDERADDLPDAELEAQLASAYGIFHGPATQRAVLRFSPHIARWVADEFWHPDQEGQWLVDGTYELTVPYGQPTELVNDVMKYGPDVTVVRPDRLRAMVEDRLRAALENYR